ncbi:hypothetical protein DSO57_1015654 [Entomophthora muscae]|uniref:Uncharacterized protein n=1 Tax=Entomophthora muscae TaxID=34485 RepID=A0ACC2TG28_9FUNG|nr:hypothetical protein DSO57_1015654 [Entomophthora muscae]
MQRASDKVKEEHILTCLHLTCQEVVVSELPFVETWEDMKQLLIDEFGGDLSLEVKKDAFMHIAFKPKKTLAKFEDRFYMEGVRNIPDFYSCVINKLSPAAKVKAPAATKQTSTVNIQTSAVTEQTPTTNVQTSAAIKQIHTAIMQKPVTTKRSPAVSMQAPTTKKTSTSTVQAPAVHTQNPVTTKLLPAATTQKPITTKLLPAVNVQAPVVSCSGARHRYTTGNPNLRIGFILSLGYMTGKANVFTLRPWMNNLYLAWLERGAEVQKTQRQKCE